MMQQISVVFALLIGLLRVCGVTHPAYQAVAHLFVGGLFGAWLVQRKTGFMDVEQRGITHFILAVSLSVLELVCFLVFRAIE